MKKTISLIAIALSIVVLSPQTTVQAASLETEYKKTHILQRMAGAVLKKVAVGKADLVVGISTDGGLWKWNPGEPWRWRRNGSGIDIAIASNGYIMAISGQGKMARKDATDAFPDRWKSARGYSTDFIAKKVAIGHTEEPKEGANATHGRWAIGSDNKLYYFGIAKPQTQTKGGQRGEGGGVLGEETGWWRYSDQLATDLSVGEDGSVWIISASPTTQNQLLLKSPGEEKFVNAGIAGTFKSISAINKDKAWAVDTKGQLWELSRDGGELKAALRGTDFSTVAATNDGTVWVTANNKVYRILPYTFSQNLLAKLFAAPTTVDRIQILKDNAPEVLKNSRNYTTFWSFFKLLYPDRTNENVRRAFQDLAATLSDELGKRLRDYEDIERGFVSAAQLAMTKTTYSKKSLSGARSYYDKLKADTGEESAFTPVPMEEIFENIKTRYDKRHEDAYMNFFKAKWARNSRWVELLDYLIGKATAEDIRKLGQPLKKLLENLRIAFITDEFAGLGSDVIAKEAEWRQYFSAEKEKLKTIVEEGLKRIEEGAVPVVLEDAPPVEELTPEKITQYINETKETFDNREHLDDANAWLSKLESLVKSREIQSKEQLNEMTKFIEMIEESWRTRRWIDPLGTAQKTKLRQLIAASKKEIVYDFDKLLDFIAENKDSAEPQSLFIRLERLKTHPEASGRTEEITWGQDRVAEQAGRFTPDQQTRWEAVKAMPIDAEKPIETVEEVKEEEPAAPAVPEKITPDMVDLDKNIPSPVQINAFLDITEKKFDSRDHLDTPQKWLDGFEILVLSRKIQSNAQQEKLANIVKKIEDTRTISWKERRWFDPEKFTETQKTKLTELITKAKEKIVYDFDKLLDFIDTQLETASPEALFMRFERLKAHENAQARKEEVDWGQSIIQSIFDNQPDRFSDEQKNRWQQIISPEGTIPETVAPSEPTVEEGAFANKLKAAKETMLYDANPTALQGLIIEAAKTEENKKLFMDEIKDLVAKRHPKHIAPLTKAGGFFDFFIGLANYNPNVQGKFITQELRDLKTQAAQPNPLTELLSRVQTTIDTAVYGDNATDKTKKNWLAELKYLVDQRIGEIWKSEPDKTTLKNLFTDKIDGYLSFNYDWTNSFSSEQQEELKQMSKKVKEFVPTKEPEEPEPTAPTVPADVAAVVNGIKKANEAATYDAQLQMLKGLIVQAAANDETKKRFMDELNTLVARPHPENVEALSNLFDYFTDMAGYNSIVKARFKPDEFKALKTKVNQPITLTQLISRAEAEIENAITTKQARESWIKELKYLVEKKIGEIWENEKNKTSLKALLDKIDKYLNFNKEAWANKFTAAQQTELGNMKTAFESYSPTPLSFEDELKRGKEITPYYAKLEAIKNLLPKIGKVPENINLFMDTIKSLVTQRQPEHIEPLTKAGGFFDSLIELTNTNEEFRKQYSEQEIKGLKNVLEGLKEDAKKRVPSDELIKRAETSSDKAFWVDAKNPEQARTQWLKNLELLVNNMEKDTKTQKAFDNLKALFTKVTTKMETPEWQQAFSEEQRNMLKEMNNKVQAFTLPEPPATTSTTASGRGVSRKRKPIRGRGRR